MLRLWLPVMLLLNAGCVLVIRDEPQTSGETSAGPPAMSVEGVTRIDYTGRARLVVRQGSPANISYRGHRSLAERVILGRSGKTLAIDARSSLDSSQTEVLVIEITLVNLERVAVRGDGYVVLEATGAADLALDINGYGHIYAPRIDARSLSMRIAGHGNFLADEVRVDKLMVGVDGHGRANVTSLGAGTTELRLTGHSAARIAGRTESSNADIEGHGALEAALLESQHAVMEIAGHGSASVNVLESLELFVEEHGDIEYRGNPVVVNEPKRLAHRVVPGSSSEEG